MARLLSFEISLSESRARNSVKKPTLEISKLKEQLELERDYLRDEIKVITKLWRDHWQIPNSLKRTLEQVEAVAQTKANVLVLGESGVGKEMIARAIHTHSPRADRARFRESQLCFNSQRAVRK